jgi:hypothetical protein
MDPFADEVIEHMVLTALGEGTSKKTPERRALKQAGVTRIQDFLRLSRNDISAQTWTEKEGGEEDSPSTTMKLSIVAVNKLMALQHWGNNDGKGMKKEEWMDLTQEAFEIFYDQMAYAGQNEHQVDTQLDVTGASTTASTSSSTTTQARIKTIGKQRIDDLKEWTK